SQTAYGVLIERKTFNEANDQDTLDAMTAAYLTQRSKPITDFRVVPTLASKKVHPYSGARTLSGLEYGDVVVGDLVTVTITTENSTISTAKRVAEIVVEVDENLLETMRFTLSESGVFVTSSMLDGAEIDDLKRRIKELE